MDNVPWGGTGEEVGGDEGRFWPQCQQHEVRRSALSFLLFFLVTLCARFAGVARAGSACGAWGLGHGLRLFCRQRHFDGE